MDSNKDSRTLNVRTAIEIFHQSTSETTDEYYLINKFAEIANLDPSSINKQALTAKLYRYKNKLKGKRGLAKNEFENETFSVPVNTVTAPKFPSGKLYEEELSSCKQACASLATELSQFKQQIESLKEEKTITSRETIEAHQYEISSLKMSHSQELKTQSKKFKLKTHQLSSQIKTLLNDKDKMLQKLNFVANEKRVTRYENVLLKRSISRYTVKRASVANNRALQRTIIRQNRKLAMLKTDNETLKLTNISLTVQLQHEQENVKMLTEKLTASQTASDLESKNIQLKRDLQNITADRDYLQALLQDNAVVDLFDPISKCYTPDTRQCIMNITSYNVASANVGPVITEVLKLANRTPNEVPSRRTVDNIIAEKLVIGQKQLGSTVGNAQNTCLYGDETRKFGQTYQTFLLSDENKNLYFLGLRDMSDKSARTTLDIFQNILDDISDQCEQQRGRTVLLSEIYT
ncbi:hypothetical protein ACJMK2_040609 [Sinanodonta woodiana]|uniref:Uncharacterized protein n=1 Tax=Sinanodonta woodiana TaxID=1069815 RepID=A0ABD3W1K8_SINWO